MDGSLGVMEEHHALMASSLTATSGFILLTPPVTVINTPWKPFPGGWIRFALPFEKKNDRQKWEIAGHIESTAIKKKAMNVCAQPTFSFIPLWAQPRERQHPQWAYFPISVSMIVVLSHNMLKPLSQVILDLLKVTTEINHRSLLAWFSIYFPVVQVTIRLLYPKFVFGYLVLQMIKSGSRALILHCDVRLPPALLRGIFLLKS